MTQTQNEPRVDYLYARPSLGLEAFRTLVENILSIRLRPVDSSWHVEAYRYRSPDGEGFIGIQENFDPQEKEYFEPLHQEHELFLRVEGFGESEAEQIRSILEAHEFILLRRVPWP